MDNETVITCGPLELIESGQFFTLYNQPSIIKTPFYEIEIRFVEDLEQKSWSKRNQKVKFSQFYTLSSNNEKAIFEFTNVLSGMEMASSEPEILGRFLKESGAMVLYMSFYTFKPQGSSAPIFQYALYLGPEGYGDE